MFQAEHVGGELARRFLPLSLLAEGEVGDVVVLYLVYVFLLLGVVADLGEYQLAVDTLEVVVVAGGGESVGLQRVVVLLGVLQSGQVVAPGGGGVVPLFSIRDEVLLVGFLLLLGLQDVLLEGHVADHVYLVVTLL